jgi:hypothetical protein
VQGTFIILVNFLGALPVEKPHQLLVHVDFIALYLGRKLSHFAARMHRCYLFPFSTERLAFRGKRADLAWCSLFKERKNDDMAGAGQSSSRGLFLGSPPGQCCAPALCPHTWVF